MARKIDPAVAASVSEAVRSVERSSSVELVVEVRPRSGSYAIADTHFAVLTAFATLVFVLFSPWTFAPEWVPVIVVVGYGIGQFTSAASNPIRRAMTRTRDREARVRTTAAASFVERGVGKTRRETGLLVYLSQLERRIELIADRGVLDAVPVLEWNQLAASIRTRKVRIEDLPDVLRALEPILVRHLPVAVGDVDELSDEVRVVSE
ncbi:MAG TPA: hypothetical protein VGS96_05680 [Thermoanaerobaculia bacterium]|jgi:putative membrane protein|nr:hypothetical protein [Thermoanaerobaculia bacterium]